MSSFCLKHFSIKPLTHLYHQNTPIATMTTRLVHLFLVLLVVVLLFLKYTLIIVVTHMSFALNQFQHLLFLMFRMPFSDPPFPPQSKSEKIYLILLICGGYYATTLFCYYYPVYFDWHFF